MLEISEVEKVMIMGLQRHHVHPAQPGQGGEDPHVPHRLSFFVNFILRLFPSLGACEDCREEKNDEDGA